MRGAGLSARENGHNFFLAHEPDKGGVMDNCIGSPHWEACETCRNNDRHYGCVVKEDIPLSLHNGDFICCDDYEQTDKPEG